MLGMTNSGGTAAYKANQAVIKANEAIKAVEGGGFRTVLERNTDYAVGDIAYTSALPPYLRLECVQAGTTGTTEPVFPSVAGGY